MKNRYRVCAWLMCGISYCWTARALAAEPQRLRLIVETDAGGDPDDEQSMVRFLLYANEWDVEGIIVNRREVRDGENLNPVRDGLGIVKRMVDAYGECWPRLAEHDPRYPKPEPLQTRTVAGYDEVDDGVQLVLRAVDAPDERPVWFLNWGTDHGASKSCLRRALDRVLAERGQEAYARFKQRIRLSSDDQFGDHTAKIAPPFPIWIDTFRPELDRKRWYHRFSGLTATAGGFDIERDVRQGHGPLGAMYPTNTTHRQKEGDTMTFLYLVPNGLGHPDHPEWGSWAGRYAPNESHAGKPYFHAVAQDTWRDTTHRENSLARWAVDLQNDFRARLDWCVRLSSEANHPPRVQIQGEAVRKARPGDTVQFDASQSSDSDGDKLNFEWIFYAEPSRYTGSLQLDGTTSPQASFTVPKEARGATLHFVVAARDDGTPSLASYGRVLVSVE